jgi:hypothetical protein
MASDQLNPADIPAHVAQLNQSERGRRVLRGLADFLNVASGLDSKNLTATIQLMGMAFSSWPGSVRDELARVIGGGDE